MKLSTNMKCSGCIAQATPVFNQTFGEGNWQVDLKDAGKILQVENSSISTETALEAVKKAGFQASIIEA
jgi:copper chaperone